MGLWGWCLLALIGCAMGQEEKRRTQNVCKVDMDCPDNAFCKQGTYCVCKDGFVYADVNGTHKGCLKVARLNEDCNQDIQCQSTMALHSECVAGKCACKPAAHFEEDMCYETALIGERCRVNKNCYLGETGNQRQVFCVRGFCTCDLNYRSSDNGTRCRRDAALGEECEDDLHCAGAGLTCRGTCRCKDHWVVHNATNSCYEAVLSLSSPCELDVQCEALAGAAGARQPGAALCLGGVCSCAYSAHAAGNPPRCWHKRRPGQECKRDEECVSDEDEPGYCLAGRCTCKNCTPDARDFNSATVTFPPSYLTAILFVAAILTH